MGHALKLNSVNFSNVAVGRVTFIESIPCVNISLSPTTVAFDTYGDTRTITATVMPLDTTDQLVWSTSNAQVATVNSNGVITIRGIGTATITATCGRISKTVAVSATSLKISAVTFIQSKVPGEHNNYHYPALFDGSGQDALVMQYKASDPSTLHFGNTSAGQLFPVPYGATSVKQVNSNSTSVYGYMWKYDTVNTVTYDGVVYASSLGRTAVTQTTAQAVSYGQAVAYQAANTSALGQTTHLLFE